LTVTQQVGSPAIYQPCEVHREEIIELGSKHTSWNICRYVEATRQHLQRCELSGICHERQLLPHPTGSNDLIGRLRGFLGKDSQDQDLSNPRRICRVHMILEAFRTVCPRFGRVVGQFSI
jgi:hypothetical protein